MAGLASACVTMALLCGAMPADTVVVCPAAFRPALAPWLALRAEQGHECHVIGNESAAEIRRQIRDLAAAGGLRQILLVGDAPAADQGPSDLTVPTHYVPSQVIHRFGGEKSIAGDNWYADLDDDHLPDLAIGRLPADSVGELESMVARIVGYETRPAPGAWRRRISLVAGLGGFGALADAALEASAKRLLIAGVPAAYATTVTYGSWRSPYCPDPRQFHDATLARFNEGCLFWVYMGHGQTRAVDRVRTPEGPHHIFDVRDCSKLSCGERPPIALLLCCSTGGFDQREDCLAEELVRSSQGPIAALAGSRVTMPYAMSVLGSEMLRIYFDERPRTLGELFQGAKRAMMLRPRDDQQSQAIDAMAQMLNPASKDLALERAEHLDLFNLIGDPLLSVPILAQLTIQAPQRAAPGEEIEISGTTPADGTVEIELVVRRDRLTFRPAPRDKYDSSTTAREEFQATYARANDTRLVATTTTVERGKFSARLLVPDSASGECHVRVFVQGERDAAAGAADVMIEPATVGTASRAPGKPGG